MVGAEQTDDPVPGLLGMPDSICVAEHVPLVSPFSDNRPKGGKFVGVEEPFYGFCRPVSAGRGVDGDHDPFTPRKFVIMVERVRAVDEILSWPQIL